ncbi:hypothetical protein BJ741DRAFT_591380 [Chytriomyces cf. hyalinus JEL632]|nr:hypothetical protein BJ741DRAFT_591291 [Chytriomyces cf. hyalinus JEL632]KAI8842604.1 hypothetical protein BJ741DRAFT_591380 [Chytriomyces cf. hyalinus JEL632]
MRATVAEAEAKMTQEELEARGTHMLTRLRDGLNAEPAFFRILLNASHQSNEERPNVLTNGKKPKRPKVRPSKKLNQVKNGQKGVQESQEAFIEFKEAREDKRNEKPLTEKEFLKRARNGKYIQSYMQKIRMFIADDNCVGIIHFGHTDDTQAQAIMAEKPVVLLAMREEMVGYVLTHPQSRQEHESCKYQFSAIRDLLHEFKSIRLPRKNKKMAKSHSNSHPQSVVSTSERVFNMSVFHMVGRPEAELKTSSPVFKAKLTCNMDLGLKTTTSESMGAVTKYAVQTLQTPALVDALNSAFFPASVERKKEINRLIYQHESQVVGRLNENGGYPLRYIARNMLNPKHNDSKDDPVIPSTLLYGGHFAGNKSFLRFTDYKICIPISEGSIISFFAARFNHEVGVNPDFMGVFPERVVEVFGSYKTGLDWKRSLILQGL